MSPLAIDESKMQNQPSGQSGQPQQILSLDPAKPPTKSIPHYHFPLVVYKHPVEKFVTIVHRNAKHEVVHEEIVPAEHLTQVVSCREHESGGLKACENCQSELKKALKDGWVEEPFVPEAPPDPRARLYEQKRKSEQKSA